MNLYSTQNKSLSFLLAELSNLFCINIIIRCSYYYNVFMGMVVS